MKKSIVKNLMIRAITIATAAILTGCASTPKAKAKVKDASGTVEIIEHKGTAWGSGQPDWVVAAVEKTSNQKALGNALGLSGKHIWVVTKRGQNLDFLKTWADQIDARSDIAAAINQDVIDFIKAQEFGSDEEMQQELSHVSGRFAEASLNGLVRETDWWAYTRQMPKDADEYITQYNYMVVFSMDNDLFDKHIRDAYKDIEEKEHIKGILETLMQNTDIESK